MSRHGRELLLNIFRRWETRVNDRVITIPITRASALPYFQAERLDDKEALHAYLKLAEQEGCIELTWGRLHMAHLLGRITLRDGMKLAAYLGLPVASVAAEHARKELLPELSGNTPWIADLLEELVERWRVGKRRYGLAVDQVAEARELLRALEAVCAGRQEGLDLRTFSARYVGDSKALERMQSRFSRIWQRQFPGDELDRDELYQSLGLVKYPHPVLFKGPISIVNRGVTIPCHHIRPYIGLAPQAVDELEFTTLPPYVLSVENPASFNRHVAEVEDDGLVLYTAGFPSPHVLRLFQLLDGKLPQTVPFFHWGDLDLGGLRIFARIQAHLGRTLHPHLMTRDLLQRYGQLNEQMSHSKLLSVGRKHAAVTPLADLILSFHPPRWLEQESVDPAPPIPST